MPKSTEVFKKSIQQHLEGAAKSNSLFAEKLKNPKKNIDDCITYILNQVQASGCNGFEDSEIYGMAMHYYDEEDVKFTKGSAPNVVVNHDVQLSPEEIEELKEKARKEVIAAEKARMTKKPAKTTTVKKEPVENLFNKK